MLFHRNYFSTLSIPPSTVRPLMVSHTFPKPLDGDSDDDSDACSVSSISPFSPAPSVGGSSYTSYDASMRSLSPTPSAYKQEFGRGLNNYSEIYRLPADAEELDRLDLQHNMFIEIMGKYIPPLPEAMADDVPGEQKAILDLGCGSGRWIMEAALDFPHCSAVAVDLVPMQSPYMPPNCRSEVDDINLGLEHFYGDFNVVHCRLISSGIRDYAHLIDQISRVLRPGGLIDLMEFDFHCYDENHHRVNLDTSTLASPWWPRWLAYLEMAARNRGGNVDAATHLHDWVSNHQSFENVVYNQYWIPVTPWRTDSAFDMRIGTAMRDDIFSFLKSGRPLLLGSGVPEQIVNELETNAYKELMEGNTRHYIRVQCVYAHKRQPRNRQNANRSN
ncbi:S-adenosyl-L-methionine-dependent methyltransferase [Armillaria novae-zelandiae]|uniref:S-adenosyl-L-methionine-dependent methyltransferase n=1 Tax=Armillaria novae-zelandiae TaxID=153914 RepID=A0AA39PDW5_9AGAR|nr:S-adenosyl-L-methionine-dependent methyltransferase [Armillaria novae-zelandiae]